MPDDYSHQPAGQLSQIWVIKLTHIRELRDKLASLLSLEERARCQRYLRQDDRDRYLGGRALCKLAAARFIQCPVTDVSIALQASGKPFLHLPNGLPHDTTASACISISHAGELVAVAISNEGDIGVDVELIHRDVNIFELAEVVCHVDEIAAIKNSTDKAAAQKFYELWVLKEAYLKATGEGLSADARSLIFSVDASSQVNFLRGPARVKEAGWDFFLRQYDDQHMLALATRRMRNNEEKGLPLLADGLMLLVAYCG